MTAQQRTDITISHVTFPFWALLCQSHSAPLPHTPSSPSSAVQPRQSGPVPLPRPPIGGPLRPCVGVRWRGGTLRAAVGDCDVRVQQPGREPAWRSQILRGLRGRWERGPGRQHEDRHGALWGRRRHGLGGSLMSNCIASLLLFKHSYDWEPMVC